MVRRGREAFREALRRHRVDAYAQHLGAPPPSAASSAYPAPVAQAVDYLLNHLGDPLTQAAMARRVGYSKNHFCRVFKQHTGESYNAFLSRARIERACVLMRDWRVDAKEAALQVGYLDVRYFRRVFLRQTGMSIPGWLEREGARP